MFSAKRRLGGLKAKRNGDNFENMVEYQARRQGWTIESIPSGCKWIAANKIIAVPTPFDYVAAKKEYGAIFFDAKTTDGKTFVKSALKPHQVNSLYTFELAGIRSGYLVWFKEIDSVVFFCASKLKALKSNCSLSIEDGIFIGCGRSFELKGIMQNDESKSTAETGKDTDV
jgi:hypothetical protein